MRYWSYGKGKWGKERLQRRHKVTAAATSICMSTRTGQTLCRALFMHYRGPPATSKEYLRIPHFSLTEPRLPELVKLAQYHTGKNSKACIKPDVNASQPQSFFFKQSTIY